MIALFLVLYSLTLQPLSTDIAIFRHASTVVYTPQAFDEARLFRWQLATAVVRGTTDEDERRVLMRIAWLEGGYSRITASCRVKGPQGEMGLFQVKPRDARERAMACGTLDKQVALALVFIRRSREVCAKFEPRDQLSLYTTGTCQNNREARNRWGEPIEFPAIVEELPLASGF